MIMSALRAALVAPVNSQEHHRGWREWPLQAVTAGRTRRRRNYPIIFLSNTNSTCAGVWEFPGAQLSFGIRQWREHKQPCSAASALTAYRGESLSMPLHRGSLGRLGFTRMIIIWLKIGLLLVHGTGEEISEGRDCLLRSCRRDTKVTKEINLIILINNNIILIL